MAAQSPYPFADLSREQVDALAHLAREERAYMLRALWNALLNVRWPPRRREAQVWPAKDKPALSPTVYP